MTLQQVREKLIERGRGDVEALLNKRTVEEWTKCEDLEFNRASQVDESDLSTWIGGAFGWLLSPEGVEYWANIAVQLRSEK